MSATETKPRKKPQDRKPKADAPLTVQVAGKSWKIDPDALDDFELLDDIARADAGEGHVMPSVLRRLFGDGQYGKAMEHLRDKGTGRVKATVAGEFIGDIFAALEAGNS